MRITSIEAYTYELGYRYGTYVMSGGRVVNTLTSTVVRIVTDEGFDGWGETCPLGSTYLPAHARGAIPALHELAPALIGADPTNLADVNKRMREALMGHNYAKSPLDVACWDIYGKAVGRPVVDLIGGRLADDMPLYKAVPLGDAESMVAFTLEQRSHGIHHFQLKVGNDPRADARASLAVVEATDDNDLILADANGGWRRQDAVVAARIMDGAERLYLEQPCPTLAECLLVRRNTTLPFVLDEVITDVAALVEAAQAGGMEAINLKLNRVGGLTNAKLVRDVAVELGIRLTIDAKRRAKPMVSASGFRKRSNTMNSLWLMRWLWMSSRANLVILKSKTTTRDNGSYELEMSYGKYIAYGLPDKIIFSFNTKNYKLPKGITFDFDNGEAPAKPDDKTKNKKGRAEISIFSYQVNKGVPDAVFL